MYLDHPAEFSSRYRTGNNHNTGRVFYSREAGLKLKRSGLSRRRRRRPAFCLKIENDILAFRCHTMPRNRLYIEEWRPNIRPNDRVQ